MSRTAWTTTPLPASLTPDVVEGLLAALARGQGTTTDADVEVLFTWAARHLLGAAVIRAALAGTLALTTVGEQVYGLPVAPTPGGHEVVDERR